jgi:rhomboid protease GluP
VSGPSTGEPPLTATPIPAAADPAARRAVSARLPFHHVRATYVFLGLIIVVFLAQLASTQLAGVDLILAFGAKDNTRIAHGEFWRLLTAVFVHASVLHIAFNGYALYILGRDVEAFAGWLRFTLIFLLAGLSGSVASLLFNPAPSVGASGAIFGLIGALVVFLYRHRKLFGERGRRNLQSIIVIALINLLIGLSGGIDNWAHLGGLAGGLILGWFLGPVWSLTVDPTQAGQGVIQDQKPMGAAQWALVLAFAIVLAGLTLLGVTLAASYNR